MLKLKNLVVSGLLMAMPMQVMADAPPVSTVNMAPIISYLLSDSAPTFDFDVKEYFEGDTRYFLTTSEKGDRTLDGAGNYTGNMSNFDNSDQATISGTYSVTDNVMTFHRTSYADGSANSYIALTHVNSMDNSSGEVFTLAVDDSELGPEINFDSEEERNNYFSFSSEYMPFTEEVFTAITNSVTEAIYQIAWYSIGFGEGSFYVIEEFGVEGADTVYWNSGEYEEVTYAIVTHETYGEVVQIPSGNSPEEYMKLSEVIDSADLTRMYPFIAWSSDAKAIINAGISTAGDYKWIEILLNETAISDLGVSGN